MNFSGFAKLWLSMAAIFVVLNVKAETSPPVSPAVISDALEQVQERIESPIYNFGMVVSEGAGENTNVTSKLVFRGSSLDNEDAYVYLKKIGVDTIVSMQTMHSPNPELCAKYGLTCRNIKFYPFFLMSINRSRSFHDSFEFVADEMKKGHKVYIHCMKGGDRTGVLAAALQVRDKACNHDLSRDEFLKLRKEVDEKLREHSFNFPLFSRWYDEVVGWIDHFDEHKSWICK